jgi:hypothetical protein
MDNPRLLKRSETFFDDFKVVIEKRCILLLCGEDDMASNCMTIEMTANVFKEPR